MDPKKNNQTNAVSPITNTRWLQSFRYKKLWLPITLLIVVLAAIAAALYVKYGSGDKGFSPENVTSFTLVGEGPGLAMNFSKPNSINSILPGIENNNNSATFAQFNAGDGTSQSGPITALTAAQVRKYPNDVLKTIEYKDVISGFLQKVDSDDYTRTLTNTQQFVTQAGRYGYKVTLGPAKSFTSANIKTYAWQFDLSASDINSKNSEQQGKAIYVLGDNGWYYFFVSAGKSEWQKNRAFFEEILNSVKVDQ